MAQLDSNVTVIYHYYQVTGKPGLMARSVVKSTVAVSGDTWHNSSIKRGWQWKGDTSSDEVSTAGCSHDQIIM